MNPFDLPPTGVPVDAPRPESEHRRRGRTALIAIATVGLIGGGIAGVSQLASADRPDLAAGATDEPSDDTIAPTDDSTDEASSDEASSDDGRSDDQTSDDSNPTDESDESGEPASDPDDTREGQIVLDDGDGDPVVIDLGDVDLGRIGELTECLGLPAFDVRPGEFTPAFPEDFPFDLGELGEFDWPVDLDGFDLDGGSVTVVGPDGVSVVDLGENGSVTVTSDNGEITVSTDGDATVSELDDLVGDIGSLLERGGLDGIFGDEAFDDLLESLPAHRPDFEPLDSDAVQACIDEALEN